MTIVWQKIDGGLAVTHMTPEELERRAWLIENRALLEQKDALLAELAALGAADAAAGEDRTMREGDRETAERRLRTARDETQLALEDLDRELKATAIEPASAQGELARIKADFAARSAEQAGALAAADQAIAKIEGEQQTRNKRHGEIAKTLSTIAELEHARDTLGFAHDDYERILKGRGDVPETHVCVGHELELPADREFRGAWIFQDGAVVHDLERARAIHRDRLRAQRQPLLEALDVAFFRAQEANDTAALAAIRTQKQALRDAPAAAAVAKAQTLDELKAAIPDCLKG